jgi:hypothetical protein
MSSTAPSSNIAVEWISASDLEGSTRKRFGSMTDRRRLQ